MKRLVMVVCALALAVPALAQDASGKWNVTVTTSNGTNEAVLVLEKAGEKLTGTVARPQGESVPVAGTQKGTDVSLSFTITTRDGPMAIAMQGRQDGDGMKGTMSLGSTGQADWTATRTAASSAGAAASGSGTAVDVTGTWAFEVITDAGTRTPTVVLKQDAGKLTGTYKSQLGEAPITGEIKEQAFTFQTTLSFDGNSFTLVYTGTSDGSAMSGKVSVADMGSGTFTGKKQAGGGR